MKLRIVLFAMICTLTVVAQKQEKKPDLDKAQMAGELSKDYLEYIAACNADSSLYVYWLYTGKEKPTVTSDTTLVKGAKVKVYTTVPTAHQKWQKPTPTWEGFQEYLKQKYNKNQNVKP